MFLSPFFFLSLFFSCFAFKLIHIKHGIISNNKKTLLMVMLGLTGKGAIMEEEDMAEIKLL
jgi:hypothetical protein